MSRPRDRTRDRRRRDVIGVGVISIVAIGYAVAVGEVHTFTIPAMALVSAGGLAIFGYAAWRARAAPTITRTRGVAIAATVWTGWLAAVLGWELWQLAHGPRAAHPTISSLVDTVTQADPARSAAVLAWLAGGWWLARR